MQIKGTINTVTGHRPARRVLRLWRSDTSGATAVEFAIVAIPFFLFLMGLTGCAFYFFVSSAVEKGMDQTSRLIRTGEAVTDKMTVNQFKQSICNGAGSWIDCQKLQIFVRSYTDGWTGLNTTRPQPCVEDGVIITNSAPGTDLIAIYSGAASDVVVVTACYKWDFPKNLPLFSLGNLPDGALMLQTATAFRSEPYPGT